MANILVIDDEPAVRAALEKTLKSAGHQVILAADGLEGVRRYRAKPADLVITDLFMPDQDGLETIVQFRNLFPEVPIIAISGKAKSGMLTAAQRLGAVAVLEKPFDNKELLSAVEKAL